MTDKELKWDNIEDRIEIIKQALKEEEQNVGECNLEAFGINCLENYIPWLISRVEELEKELKKMKECNHTFIVIPDPNPLIGPRIGMCSKCGYRP